MGFLNELKKLARPYAEDEDDELDDFDSDLGGGSGIPSAPASPRMAEEPVYSAPSGRHQAGNGKVVNIRTATQLQVVLVSPIRFEDVSDIAEQLRDKRAVVLNLESCEKDIARRLVDFLSGCAYALDGKIKKIAISTYLITPYNVDIVGDVIDELESSGVYL